MWGWQYLAATGVAVGAGLIPGWYTPLTVLRFLLLVPAFLFTSRYSQGADRRYIADVDQAMVNMRRWAYVGIGMCLIVAAAIYIWL